MDAGSIGQLIVLVVLLALSAFFSSAETALTTSNINKLKAIADEGGRRSRAAARVIKMRENSSKLLSAVLIGNNIVNMSASALMTVLCTRVLGSAYVGVATGVLTMLVLIFGEITPKSVASLYNVKLAMLVSYPIYILMIILTPVIWLLDKVCGGLFKLVGIDPNANPNQMTESELRKVVDVSEEEGVIEESESKMISNVVDFGDAVSKDIMIPRADMVCADVNISYEDLIELIKSENYSRIPIYSESKDHIIGILHVKDLIVERELKGGVDISVRELMREPVFVYEYQRTAEIFSDMKTSSVTMCIVLDEYGITAGLITMEDLIEEIVGDIRDEYDEQEDDLIVQQPNGSYSVDASVKLDDLNDAIDTSLESDNYDSLGGLMIELLDRLPEEGEAVRTGDVLLTVTKVDGNRIVRVNVKQETV